MDTATHFAMGFGLAALAHLDPAVATHPGLAEAVTIGTVLGSQAPDLDGFTRLWGSASYIRNHRGISHSIPFLFIWSFGIFGLIQWLAPQTAWLHVLSWTFLAVVLHVFVDLFNSYGTQGLAPFNKKWISLHTIFIFDPFIFGIHLMGFMLWSKGMEPGSLFLIIYLIIAGYYTIRYRIHKQAKEAVQISFGRKGNYTLIPTFNWNQWTLLVQTDTHWYVGEVSGTEPIILDTFPIKPENEYVALAKTDEKVQAFLSFTSYAHVEVREHHFGYEVRWSDLRYRSKNSGHYMFVAVVYIDKTMAIRDSFVGWIHRGEEQLAKKMDPEKEIQLN
ncbi:metal-dependent hydrolase [Brevibacillus ginsengisoli]|uniref:metal-dependent hydrolase n=1 Tax=Brevibacillus ginsengisoli TaxID=363854 RepID=UPI003CF2908E